MADFQSIYNRLNNGTQFTPLSAQTFGDWSIEAGDIVTVTKDGTSYQTPVMRSGLEWRGASLVTIESTGNKERDALNKLSKQDYLGSGAGSGLHGYYGARRQGFLYLAFEDELGSLRSELYMDHEQLRLAFEKDINSTRSELRMTAESLRIAFDNEIQCTRSEFLMTADSLRIAFDNDINCLRSEFVMTAESLRIAFEDDINSLRSEFRLTAESLRISFEEAAGSIRSEFNMTAESLRIAFDDDINSVRSEFKMTVDSLRIGFEDDVNSLRSEFKMTSESLRVAFDNMSECVRSEFLLTAESVRLSFQDDINSARSEFNMTAESLRVAFDNEAASIRSEMQMSADSLRIAFENDLNSTRSAFVISSESIMMAFDDAVNSVRSEFVITAESLRSSFEDDIEGVQSAIEQEANRISLVVEGTGANAHVKPAAIVAAVKDNKSSLELSADDIYLDGSIKLGDKLQVLQSGELYAKSSIYVAPGSVFNGDHVGNFYYSEQQEGHSVRMPLLKKARVDNGVLKIWTYSDPEGSPSITFSKATTTSNKISGSWSGGIFTVATDDVNGQQPPLMTTSLKVVLTGDVNVSSGKARQYAQVWYFDPALTQYTINPYTNTGMPDQQIEIDTSSVYTAGKDAVRLKIVPHSGSAWNYNVGLDKSESGSEITEYAIWLKDEGLDTETGEHPISAMIGANTVSQTIYVQDYNQGQDSIINAGAPLNVTANTSGNVALNRYVTTYNVNVPAPTVKVKLDREYVSSSGTIDAVVPTTDGSGYDFLRAWVQDGGLVQSGTNPGNKTRQIRSFIGSTPIFDTTYTDYKDGWDAVGTPQWGDWNVTATGSKSSTLNTGNYVYLQVAKKTNNASRDRLVQLSISGSASYDDFDSNHKAYVYVRYYDATAGAWKYIMRREIDATSVYEAGQQSASEPDIEFDKWTVTDVDTSTSAIISNQIKFKHSSGSKQGVRNVYLTQDSSFTSKKKWVWMRDNASNGTAVGKIQVDATSVYNDGFNAVGAPTFSQWQETDGTTVITPSSTAPATTATSRNVQMKWVTNNKTTGDERKATKNLYLSVEMSGSKPYFDSNHVAYVRLRDYSGGYRYIARVAVDASSVYAEGAGQVVVAKPAFEFQSGIGTQNKKYTTVTAKATSGSKTESTGTYLELQSGTYGSRSNHCINLYSEEAGDIIARYDIESMINGSAADANVVFDSWLNNLDEDGTNNVLTNTARFRNESNSAKTAAKTIFMDYNSGFENHRKWIKVHADSADGATVLRYQVDASSEWNAAIASPSVSGEQAGNSDSINVSLLSGQKWKVNFTLVDASGSPRTTSYVVKAPTTGGSERVTGNWEYDNNNVPQFVVSSSPTGSALPAALTKVLLKVEHGYADAIAYAKIYKDNNSSNVNLISSQGMKLEQDVVNKRVNLTTNGSTAAWIDISATYNAGVGQGYSNVHHATPDAYRNRAVNGKTQYWNAILRSSNGTELRTVYADMNQGTGFVAVGHDYTLTSNGTHVINDIVSSITVNVPIPDVPEEEHDIDLGSVWTTDRTLSGWTKLNTLKRLYEQAKADSEFVVFEVTCGDSSKVYYMEP